MSKYIQLFLTLKDTAILYTSTPSTKKSNVNLKGTLYDQLQISNFFARLSC